MIPKKIHYCWFGGNDLPRLAKRCIRSWKKYCPDYEIIRWDESNYDIKSAPLYVRQAYEAKKWAFVTDYVRLQLVYEHGGIYMDTDVELVKSLDGLLDNDSYFGLESKSTINTGLGFGACKNSPILLELLTDYQNIPFVKEDGTYDLETCTVRNTRVFIRHGLQESGEMQLLDGTIRILPTCVMRPFHDWDGTLKISPETVSIHWYNASWQPKSYQAEKRKSVREKRKRRRKDFFHNLPQRTARKIFGDAAIEKLKEILKK